MASMSPPKVLGGVFVLLAVVVVGLLLTKDGPAPPSLDLNNPTPPVTSPGPEQPDVDTNRAAPTHRTRVELPDEPIDDGGPPQSYRRALSGITGRMVERDLTPVGGMRVELLGGSFGDAMVATDGWFDAPRELDLLKGTAVTGDDGRFTFKDVEPSGIYALSVDAGGPRGTLRFLDSTPFSGEVRDIGDVVLEPYITFLGRVVNLDEEPVPGAVVRATTLPAMIFSFGAQNVRADGGMVGPEGRGGDGRRRSVLLWPQRVVNLIERFPIPTAKTNENGEFTLPGVPYGLVSVLVEKADYVTLVHGPVPSGAAGGERSLGTLRLDEGEELVGRVEDQNGVAVAGVEIYAGPKLMDEDVGLVWPVGRTGEDGRFQGLGFTDAEHFVAARAPGRFGWIVIDDVYPGMQDAVIVVPAEVSLTVTAVAPDGSVVPHPSLVLRTFPDDGPGEVPILSPPIPLQSRTTSLDDGSVLIGGLSARPYSLMVQAKGYAVAELKVDLSEQEPRAEVTLQPAVSIQVLALSAADETPVEYASVSATSRKHDIIDEMPICQRRTGEDGRATLTGLLAGVSYQVRVEHPGYTAQIMEVTAPSSHEVQIPLFQGGSIAGRVHNRGRAPEASYFVAAAHDDMVVVPSFAVSDADGNFRFERLSPGQYNVVVMDRFADRSVFSLVTDLFNFSRPQREIEVAVVEGEETRADIDLAGGEDVGPTATIRGRVLINGAPVEHCQVSATAVWEWRHRRSVRTDSSGVFDFGAFPIGEHSAVTISVTPAELLGSGSPWGDAFYSETLRLSQNDARDLLIQLRTGAVSGRVVSADRGAPVSGASVRIKTSGMGDPMRWTTDADGNNRSEVAEAKGSTLETVTGRDGTFELTMVPAGTYDLTAEAKGFVETTVPSIEVPFGGQSIPVTAQMEQAIIVAGKLTLPSGVTPDHVWMQWHKRDTDEWAGVSVESGSMRFETDDLSPGTYDINVSYYVESADGDNQWLSLRGEATVPPGGTRDLSVVVTGQG